MKRFIEGADRGQSTMLPELLDDYVDGDNQVRVVDVFVDQLNLATLGFERVQPAATGRPAYHPSVLLKLYIYGYLNRIQSSRRLEREAQRNVELMWLTGRLKPDFKTIANFRKDNGKSIRNVCRQFVVLCQQLDLFSDAVVAIDGSKFKAVNSSDRNFTDAKLKRRMEEIESNISRYLAELDSADRQEPAAAKPKRVRLEEKIKALKLQMASDKEIEAKLVETGDAMRTRRCTVEHPYGTIKAWMGATHFLTRGLERVKTEMSLHVLAYNLRRLIAILGITDMMKAIKAFIHLPFLKTALLSIAVALQMESLRKRYGAVQRVLALQN